MKLEQHVALRFDRFAVDQRGLIAPLLNGFQHIGKKVRRTVDWLYVFNAAVFADRGNHADDIGVADLIWCNLRIDARHQSADDHFFAVVVERPERMCGGHAHGTLDPHGNAGRFQHAFSRKLEEGTAITALHMDFHGLAFGRVHLNHGRTGVARSEVTGVWRRRRPCINRRGTAAGGKIVGARWIRRRRINGRRMDGS